MHKKSIYADCGRHAHGMPVSYVPYGQDATVFYGNSVPPKVEWHHEVLSVKKTTKYYKVNETLPPGQVRLVVEGMDGATLKSWITIRYSDKIIKKQLGKSVYSPLPHIYEKGL